MKNKLLKNTIAMVIASITILTPIAANAAWKQDTQNNWNWSENGVNITGWKQINEAWYYFDSNGVMKTGWLNYNGTWYYLNASGAMVCNTTIDGYCLGATGAMQTNISTATSTTNTTQQATTNQQKVYVVSNGKVYHSSPECSNMKSPIEISLDEALSKGLKPCPKCH